MITIRWLNADPMMDLKEANLSTIRKVAKTKYSVEDFRRLLRSEHSTLRFLSLVVHDDDCHYTVATQIVRTTKEHTQPEMSSGRPDWNGGKARDYTQTRWLHVKLTPVGLIRMCEDRTCMRAEKATRDWVHQLVHAVSMHEDPYLAAIAPFLAPVCTKLEYCKEGRNCFGCVRR